MTSTPAIDGSPAPATHAPHRIHRPTLVQVATVSVSRNWLEGPAFPAAWLAPTALMDVTNLALDANPGECPGGVASPPSRLPSKLINQLLVHSASQPASYATCLHMAA